MANAIELFKKYIANLDEVYKVAATTSILDGDRSLVRMGANTNEIVIPKMTMSGLSDYSRSTGYEHGDVNLTYETVVFNYDRGITFDVDAMDNEETAGIAFGSLSSEFIRTQVVPEMDAFRFASYAGIEGISVATPGEITSGNDALTALITAQNTMDEAEVDADGRVLFITPTLYNLIYNVDTSKSKEVLSSFSTVQKVPNSRFNTKIELYNKAEGYGFAVSGQPINFMVIHRAAVLQYTKHTVNKVITPEANQTGDGWKFFYRSYGLADVYENKVKGIYVHARAA